MSIDRCSLKDGVAESSDNCNHAHAVRAQAAHDHIVQIHIMHVHAFALTAYTVRFTSELIATCQLPVS
jgi:hypothetical protein